ncbi:MAG: peptidase M64 [Lentimicrobiaceae bacterium]|nr:peptidase M64 [Lentimicrobiaceae bacterium]
MRKLLIAILVTLGFSSSAQFSKYFYNKTLRIDYVHTGNATSDAYAIDELIEEPFWGGSKVNLVNAMDYGNYKVTVQDIESGTVIYKHNYSSLFSEWQTTGEAKETFRAYPENVVIPSPRKPVMVDFYNRTRNNEWILKFSYKLDPSSYFIKKERRHEYPSFVINQAGDPSVCLDIVFIPEGYTADEMEKFKADCNRLSDFLLKCNPFDEYKNKINIVGVLAPSIESGADIPGKGVWKKTILNSSFYTFDIDRYLTTYDMKSVRDVAANVPYDQICIVANSQVYGGGGIYNHYALFTSDNPYANYVFVHEFGHSFAGLGDEYYNSEVAYEDFYNLKVEPWEPNLTTLVDFDAKWKSMVTPGAPIPTPASEKDKYAVGAYEGGGYMTKGVYRPAHDCTMKSLSYNNFCPVCKKAIRDMLETYTH